VGLVVRVVSGYGTANRQPEFVFRLECMMIPLEECCHHVPHGSSNMGLCGIIQDHGAGQ